eukprot:scaffold87113_cov69-Phaeocystis_antarctica.AAC.5
MCSAPRVPRAAACPPSHPAGLSETFRCRETETPRDRWGGKGTATCAIARCSMLMSMHSCWFGWKEGNTPQLTQLSSS